MLTAPLPGCGAAPNPQPPIDGRRWDPPDSGNDSTGPRRPARTNTAPGVTAAGNAATPDTAGAGGVHGQVEQRVRVPQRVTVGDHRGEHRRERGGGAVGRGP